MVTKNRFFNIALCVHVLCGILGVMIICLVPEKDHVRWGLGYLVGYLFFVSLVLLSFLPKGLPRWMKTGIRIYRAVYWVGALVLMFIPKGLFFLFVLQYECGSNSTKIAEDGQYIIRLYVTASLFGDYNEKRIYRKQGILEKYIGSFDAGDISPHDRYHIESFRIDEERKTFTGKCRPLVEMEDWHYPHDSIVSFPIAQSIH